MSAVVSGKLELFKGNGKIPIILNLQTRPGVMAAAIAAAGFLASGGGTGTGEQAIQLKGPGLEYAESREYQPGDALRKMDWKATARLGKPIIREYYQEGCGRIHLGFEKAAPYRVSIDELSTQFLTLTTTLAKREVPLGLTIHNGNKVEVHKNETGPKEAVSLALKHALKAVQVEIEELYSVLEPTTSREVKQILQRSENKNLKNFSKLSFKHDKKKNPLTKFLRV